jgi:protein disulfide-isomerase
LAKKHNLSDALEELFKSLPDWRKEHKWFANLSKLGLEAGLEFKEIEAVLKSDVYAKEVKAGYPYAVNRRSGVPFFVLTINTQYLPTRRNFCKNFRKYGKGKFISKPTLLNTTDADSCGPDGCN